MTGIQALERAAKSLPMKPGHVERREFEYIRHGTKALIAAFDCQIASNSDPFSRPILTLS
jgi:putative transposase